VTRYFWGTTAAETQTTYERAPSLVIARESSHLYFEWDRHWTVEGHRLAARLIQK
jgi:hypothetical protein